jgi:hypothetical protein
MFALRRVAVFVASSAIVLSTGCGAPYWLPWHSTQTPNRSTLEEIKHECIAVLARFAAHPTDRTGAEQARSRELAPRLWGLLSQWTAAYLDEHPTAPAGDVAAALAGIGQLQFSALQLVRGDSPAYVVAAYAPWGGTLFVVARDRHTRFRPTWSIADVRARPGAPEKELRYWTSADPSPIGGTVYALPAKRTGEARFYVDAVTLDSQSSFFACQLSIWEWDGQAALPVLMQTYGRTFDTLTNELHDGVLTVHTKEVGRALSTTSRDANPAGVWNITIAPNGIQDQHPKSADPWFSLLDALFDRTFRRQDVSEIASRSVADALTAALAHVSSPCDAHLRVRHRGWHAVVDLASDRCGDFRFWIAPRRGRLYVVDTVPASGGGATPQVSMARRSSKSDRGLRLPDAARAGRGLR